MNPESYAIVWPLLAQMGLVFAVYIALGMVRGRAVKRHEMEYKEFTPVLVEPAYVARVSQHLKNQFELPVIFYALVLLLVTTKQATTFDVALAWMFVATRLVHSAAACFGTRIRPRSLAFTAGLFVLLAMLVHTGWVLCNAA